MRKGARLIFLSFVFRPSHHHIREKCGTLAERLNISGKRFRWKEGGRGGRGIFGGNASAFETVAGVCVLKRFSLTFERARVSRWRTRQRDDCLLLCITFVLHISNFVRLACTFVDSWEDREREREREREEVSLITNASGETNEKGKFASFPV